MSSAAATGTATYSLDETEAEARSHVQADSFADTLTAAEAAARYIGRDMRYLVSAAHIDLAKGLGMPDDSTRDPALVVELLMHDLERMLHQNLISAVHLILSNKNQTPNANNQISVRYHALYEVRRETMSRGVGIKNDLIKAPPKALADAEFVLCISWRDGVSADRKRRARRPEYFFNWTPNRQNFDHTGMVRYRFGGLNTNVIQINRVEYAHATDLG